MTDQEAIELALRQVPRNEDGSLDEKAVIEAAARLIEIDADQERRKRAARALQVRCGPGKTEAIGALQLFDDTRYAYEPDRLIKDDDGHVIEQDAASTHFKWAEARRAQRNLDRCAARSRRKNAEVGAFQQWTINQQAEGRDLDELRFGTFVREEDYWVDDDAPPEVGSDVEDDIA